MAATATVWSTRPTPAARDDGSVTFNLRHGGGSNTVCVSNVVPFSRGSLRPKLLHLHTECRHIMRYALILVAILIAFPPAFAQSTEHVDATITIAPGADPVIEGPAGLVTFENATLGESYRFNLTLPNEYTSFEFRVSGLDIERVKQLVPMLVVSEEEFPLFEPFPNKEIWDVDGTGNVFYAMGTPEDVVLRLGVAGPRNVTLALTRDVTPPTFEIGEVSNITHFSWYQETRTNELVLGDLQVRKVGADEWVVNPTPVFHFRQRFPIQGLVPDTEYEAHIIFTDWAGNIAESAIYHVTSAPAPRLPLPVVTPVLPVPNSTIETQFVTFRARVESPESPLDASALSVFVDKRAITTDIRYENGELYYSPPEPLSPGKHSFAVEVYNAAGGKGEAHWTFTVAGSQDTPFTLAPLLAVLAAAAFFMRRKQGHVPDPSVSTSDS